MYCELLIGFTYQLSNDLGEHQEFEQIRTGPGPSDFGINAISEKKSVSDQLFTLLGEMDELADNIEIPEASDDLQQS